MNEMTQALSDAHEKIQSETAARIATLESLRHADASPPWASWPPAWPRAGHSVERRLQPGRMIAPARRTATSEAEREDHRRAGAGDDPDHPPAPEFARRREPMRTPEDLRGLSDRTLSLLSPLRPRGRPSLRGAGPAIEVEVDGGQLQQVADNLLMNALQSMSGPARCGWRRPAAGGAAAGVDGGEGDFVRLDVVDEGTGSPPRCCPHLRAVLHHQGVGEGTAWALRLLRIVRDTAVMRWRPPGQGERFSVYLPRGTDMKAASWWWRTTGDAGLLEQGSPREYELRSHRTGRGAQRGAGRDYEWCSRPQHARRDERVELCGGGGHRPDVPVVVLTAFGSLETAIASIRAGAYDFVTKPVELDALAIVLDRAVSHRRMRDEIPGCAHGAAGASEARGGERRR